MSDTTPPMPTDPRAYPTTLAVPMPRPMRPMRPMQMSMTLVSPLGLASIRDRRRASLAWRRHQSHRGGAYSASTCSRIVTSAIT